MCGSIDAKLNILCLSCIKKVKQCSPFSEKLVRYESGWVTRSRTTKACKSNELTRLNIIYIYRGLGCKKIATNRGSFDLSSDLFNELARHVKEMMAITNDNGTIEACAFGKQSSSRRNTSFITERAGALIKKKVLIRDLFVVECGAM